MTIAELFLTLSCCWQRVTVTGNMSSSSKHPQRRAALDSTVQSPHKRNVVNRVFWSVTHRCAVPLLTASWLNDIFVLGTGVEADRSSYLNLNVGHTNDSSVYEPNLEKQTTKKLMMIFYPTVLKCRLVGCVCYFIYLFVIPLFNSLADCR